MRRSLAVMATSALLLVSACGGGDEETGAPAEAGGDRLSKADFLEQGDAICAGLEADGSQLAPPADEQDYARFITEAVELAQGTRDEFAALSPPEDGEQVKKELLDALDASIESAEGAATAAEGGDTVTAEDLLSQASEQGDAADGPAQDYGFQECGTSSDDEEEPAAEGALTKEDFIAAGDAICQQLTDDTELVAEPADETDLARYLNEVLPLAADAREAFSTLAAPEDGVGVQQELLAALDASLEAGAGASIAAEQGDTVTAGDLLTQASEAGNAANASAQAYGFQQCGSEAG